MFYLDIEYSCNTWSRAMSPKFSPENKPERQSRIMSNITMSQIGSNGAIISSWIALCCPWWINSSNSSEFSPWIKKWITFVIWGRNVNKIENWILKLGIPKRNLPSLGKWNTSYPRQTQLVHQMVWSLLQPFHLHQWQLSVIYVQWCAFLDCKKCKS